MGLPSPMHQDNYYWNLKNPRAITLWIALTRAFHKNGSVEYLIGSHKEGLIKHIPSNAPGSSQKIKNLNRYKKKYKKKIFCLDVGDCLIHHSLIIHGSKPNYSPYPREGFTIQLIDKNTSINNHAYKKYKDSLNQQIIKRRVN